MITDGQQVYVGDFGEVLKVYTCFMLPGEETVYQIRVITLDFTTLEAKIDANLVCPHRKGALCEIRINSAGKDPMFNLIVLSDSQTELHRINHPQWCGDDDG